MIFERLESNVRGYCRTFPCVFASARGSILTDEKGRSYIDFLAGAGTLNYGHNHPRLKQAAVDYLERDGVLHGLDMHTQAKRDFITAFEEIILKPRELEYKLQFTGPTGTNAVEAAMKLARKITGRSGIVAFTNAFHGVSLGALAATANSWYRDAAGMPLGNVTHMPFDGYLGENIDTVEILERYIDDPSSGMGTPAGVIVETVQGEGGINVARHTWLRRLSVLCRRHRIPLIVDDIQVGCGRTGTFFSFEPAEIEPDIIVLSKSLSGFGLPMSLVLMKPELDIWKPGQHNGTFRGNNLAFVTAAEALRAFWSDSDFSNEIRRKGELIRQRTEAIRNRFFPAGVRPRGRGMIQGLAFEKDPTFASEVVRACFRAGLVIETSGALDQVVKILPALTIPQDELARGLAILEASIERVLQESPTRLGIPTIGGN